MRIVMQGLLTKGFRGRVIAPLFYIALISLVFISVGITSVDAQKKKPLKKKTVRVPKIARVDLRICIPPATDFISVLQIDQNGKVTLTTQTSSGSHSLFDARLSGNENEILAALFNKTAVTVKADPSLRFDLVVKILKGLRQALNRCFNVEASTNTADPYVYIYPEPRSDTNLPVYPNPLLLVVRLDKDSRLTLNNEDEGTLKDTSKLKDHLTQIFRAREENGVFREGTYRVEKTVRVAAADTASFGDLVKIVDAIKEVGASPVGLQIDEMEDAVEILLDIEMPTTQVPKPQ
jgi:biopolymer transport protein ExbD